MNTNRKIVSKLEELEKQEGTLPQYLELYRQLLLIQLDTKGDVPSTKIVLTGAERENALKNGIPLLKWDVIPINWAAVQRSAQAALIKITEHSDAADKDQGRVILDVPTLQQIARAWYEGSSLYAWADRLAMNEARLSAMVDCAMKPFLVAQARNLMKSFPQESWRRGYCPVCGGKPDFAYLDKDRGARWLICSHCDAEWLFQRLMCPYCGNDNQPDLAYYTDDKELYRLYVCQRCQTYLKAIDLRKAGSEILLPLERVLTADMDRQGQEKGFKGI